LRSCRSTLAWALCSLVCTSCSRTCMHHTTHSAACCEQRARFSIPDRTYMFAHGISWSDKADRLVQLPREATVAQLTQSNNPMQKLEQVDGIDCPSVIYDHVLPSFNTNIMPSSTHIS
jgi:hypothetical protein